MQQILCTTAAMHAPNNILECLYTKGLFAWVLGQLAVQPKSGLSLVHLRRNCSSLVFHACTYINLNYIHTSHENDADQV